jgi:spore maturation protein CgeB
MIFENNISVLRETNPELAEALMTLKRGTSPEIVYGRTNLPSLRINDITLHSLFDPEKEAKAWVRHYDELIKDKSAVFVLGFGLGYHLLELCRVTDREVTVFEPSIDILRTALETVDLTSILSRIKIVTDGKVENYRGKIVTLQHNPSVNLDKTYFEQILHRLKSREIIHDGLKILVVSPVNGGSLPIARYCSSALKKMGHNVELIDNSRFSDIMFSAKEISKDMSRYGRIVDIISALISEIVIARCEVFKPDLVFALAQAPLTPECLETLWKSRIPTAFWFVEDFRLMNYWKRIAAHYDYFFTIQKGVFFSELKQAGIKNYHYLPTAACPELHKQVTLSEEEQYYYGSDVSFFGAGYYNRRHFFKGLLDFDFRIWGSDWDMNSSLAKCVQRSGATVGTDEMVKIFNATKININLHSSTYHKGINPFGDFVNPRTFEIISCGGFQLVDKRSEIEALFETGKEIVLFKDLDDMRQKIIYYLNNPDERESIVERAMQRVMKDHTYEHRMKEMLEFLADNGFRRSVWSEEGEDVNSLVKESGDDTELAEYLSRFAEKGRITLSDIAEEITNGEGDISGTEALFLLMNEFVR